MERREGALPDPRSLKEKVTSVDFVAGAAFAAFSALLLVVAYLPHQQSLTSSLDTMYWPRLVLWGLFAVSLILVGGSLWRTGEGSVEAGASESAGDRWPLIAIACCIVYFVLVGIAGFLISSLLLGAAFPLLLGERRWVRIVAFSLTLTAVVWLVVIDLMHVLLPRGVGVFHTFSLLFY
jgi:hypothetical protein